MKLQKNLKNLQVSDGGVAEGISGYEVREQVGVRPGVDDLVRVDASKRVSHRVSDVVHATLEAGQPHVCEALKDVGDIRQHHSSYLPVLSGRHVRTPFFPVPADHTRQKPRLSTRCYAVWEFQPHHESPVCKMNQKLNHTQTNKHPLKQPF